MKATQTILALFTTALFCALVGMALDSAAIALGLFAVNLALPFALPKYSLFTVCGAITASILRDCETPIVGGNNTTLYLVNKDDISSVTRDGSNTNLITAIALKYGKTFFKYEGSKAQSNSLEPEQHYTRKKYSIGFDHVLNVKIFSATSDTKAELEQLANGLVVAIVENNYRGDDGDGAFEIYGLSQGLEVSALDRVLADADTQGAFSIVLKTPEDNKEPHLPATFFDTDYDTTKAALEDLL